jgi:glycosyltransferase involved in cell wall biosynthesis
MTVSVALPMLNLVPGAMGGTETYARALTRLLDMSRVDATAYLPVGAEGFSGGVPEVIVPQVKAGASTAERLGTIVKANLLGSRLWGQWKATNVVHYPFTIAIPPAPRGIARVVTVFDVQHLDRPGSFTHIERMYRYATYDAPVPKADLVITISEFARNSVIHYLGIPPERIRTIHLGFDNSVFSPGTETRENFLLYPARPYLHKNHPALIKAVELLRRQDPDLRLVLTGEGLERLGELPDWVERRGLVSIDELKRLYHTARLMVFPSLYEGFGLPPLEAMASGCPVAASSAASIPEVVADAAILFDPNSPEAIADGIERAFSASADLVARGLVRAEAAGGWDRCVRAHEDAYLDAAALVG